MNPAASFLFWSQPAAKILTRKRPEAPLPRKSSVVRARARWSLAGGLSWRPCVVAGKVILNFIFKRSFWHYQLSINFAEQNSQCKPQSAKRKLNRPKASFFARE